MSKDRFSVFERSLSYVAEPELIAKGLSYAEARDLAGAKIGEFISRWSCNFEIKREARDNGETILEAVKPIEGSSLSWGYRVSIKPEPEPTPEPDPEREKMIGKRFSLLDIMKAFGALDWSLQIEGANTQEDRLLLPDIETDIRKILEGELVLSESGELVTVG